MFRRSLLVSCCALLLIALLPGSALAKTDIEFILDASGSMRAAMGGSTQMEVARQAIKSALDALPPDASVALRVYAHRAEQSDKAASCVDSELLIPFGPLNKSLISAKVDAVQPRGYTPIAYALEQAEKDFGIERESTHVLVLVSDGEETCGGDPVKVVQGLIARGFKITLNAVGFNVDPKAQAQLKAIAQAGGGQYYDARDPAALAGALKEIAQKSFLVQKATSVYGSEIQGGDAYEKAVQLPLGQELRLNHHQRKGQYDYFSVDLQAGQSLVVTMNTGAKGVGISGQSAQENDNPYAGYQIHGAQRNKIAGEEFIGARNATKGTQVDAAAPQRLYLLIGSAYSDMHKDHPFKAEVKSSFDAGGASDAGSTPETALPLQRQDYPENHLTAQDEGDVFKIPTAKGEVLTIQILPENLKSRLKATLLDELRAELGRGASPNDGAGFRVSGVANGPAVFLRVQHYYPSGEPTKYSLKFETAPAAAAEAPPAALPTAIAPPISPPSPAEPPPSLPAAPPVATVPVVAAPPAAAAAPGPAAADMHPAPFSWTDRKALKVLSIVLGSGFLLGLLSGIFLTLKVTRRRSKAS